MKLEIGIALGSVLTAVALAAVFTLAGLHYSREIWLGMAGPTLAAILALCAMRRRLTVNPAGMSRLMMQAFALKFLFFAVYVTVLVKYGVVRLQPFGVCFVGFYLALHGIEAIWLRRVQTVGNADNIDNN